MNLTSRSQSVRNFALELDVVRGLAAILMIVNHAGYRLLTRDDSTLVFSASSVAVYIGQFAPVLFFFATGFGIGLGGAKGLSKARVISLAEKACLLILADQFFFWREGAWFGIDFFSYIALATVILTVVHGSRRAVAVSIFLIVVALGARYGLGSLVRSESEESVLIRWILGNKPVENSSYPLVPWIVFALLGGIGGRVFKHYRDEPKQWFIGLTLSALAAFGLSLIFWQRGMTFFRWGTVSFAFFVLSIGVLASVCLMSLILCRLSSTASKWVSMGGVASFCVIPVHYALLDLVGAFAWLPISTAYFFPALLSLVVASAVLSVRLAALIDLVNTRWTAKSTYGVLLPVEFILMVLIVSLWSHHMPLLVALWVMLGQLAVAVLLGSRSSVKLDAAGVKAPLANCQSVT